MSDVKSPRSRLPRLLPFPITLCALLYALCGFTVPYADSIFGANQFLGGFLFFGRSEIQDPRPDLDEVHCLFLRGLEAADERMPFVGSASGRGGLGLPALKPARPTSNRYWLYASKKGWF